VDGRRQQKSQPQVPLFARSYSVQLIAQSAFRSQQPIVDRVR
jgi:hypothetical protein